MNTTTPTPYNPDHARRGVVFVIETMNGFKFFYTIVNNIPVEIQRDNLEPLELGEHKTPEIPLKEIEEAGCKVYMASKADCIDAGIEYIEPPTQWLPIESAPKNDKAILLTDGKAVYRGNYYDDKYAKTPRPYWDVGLNRSTDNRSVNITHWMPLPQPPKDE